MSVSNEAGFRIYCGLQQGHSCFVAKCQLAVAVASDSWPLRRGSSWMKACPNAACLLLLLLCLVSGCGSDSFVVPLLWLFAPTQSWMCCCRLGSLALMRLRAFSLLLLRTPACGCANPQPGIEDCLKGMLTLLILMSMQMSQCKTDTKPLGDTTAACMLSSNIGRACKPRIFARASVLILHRHTRSTLLGSWDGQS